MYRHLFALICVLCCITLTHAQNKLLTIDEVFDMTSHMNGFQEMEYIEDDIKFPASIGTPKMIVHGNADPRAAIIDLLNRLPKGSLVYDSTNEQGKFDRMFFNDENNHLLYVHVGLGGNDTVLILFIGGTKHNIQNFIRSLSES